MHCYCTICRKTAGSGGYAINLGGDAAYDEGDRQQERRRSIHALIRETASAAKRSPAAPLLQEVRQPAVAVGPALARARSTRTPRPIDTPLPKPPEVVEAELANALTGSMCRAARGTCTARAGPGNRCANGTSGMSCSRHRTRRGHDVP